MKPAVIPCPFCGLTPDLVPELRAAVAGRRGVSNWTEPGMPRAVYHRCPLPCPAFGFHLLKDWNRRSMCNGEAHPHTATGEHLDVLAAVLLADAPICRSPGETDAELRARVIAGLDRDQETHR